MPTRSLTIADQIKMELGAAAPLSYGALYHAVRQQCDNDSRQIHATIRALMSLGHVVAWDEDQEVSQGWEPYESGLDWTDSPYPVEAPATTTL